MCVVNMCQQGRKYHTSLAMSAADGLFACCECAFKVWVCEWYKIGQCECAFSNARVSARLRLCVCVFSSNSWLILLVTHAVSL